MTPRGEYFNESQLDLLIADDEIIVDSFAGGGGASYGIEMALGRSPDIAINHDREAIALHAANHPTSEHFPEDVWHVDPVVACRGRKVGLMWLSPDCKHFSKAKGGKPVSKKIRGLAWTAVRWANAVRPRVIILENVEEFQTWGPVDRTTNRPDPLRKGFTFRRFVSRLARLGYRVEWRELRACDFGAPTIRKRLFLIARCDGRPITWPAPTHGKSHAFAWRTAAECIDWSIPCPSIFERKKELAPNTMRRIARGIQRFVIDASAPFIVEYHSPKRPGDDRIRRVDEPLATQSTENRFGLATPFVVRAAHGEFDASGKKRGKGEHELGTPLGTVLASGEFSLVAPFLKPRYGENPDPSRRGGLGQAPRVRSLDEPAPTIVPTGNGGDLVAAFLAKHYGGVVGVPVETPAPTVTSVDHNSLVTAHIAKHYGERVGSSIEDPLHTVTAESVHHALVASSLLNLRGTANSQLTGRSIEQPLPTISGGGIHAAEVRAFLTQYNGTAIGQTADAPIKTLPTHDRFGIVVVEGVEYAIIDIGMRMLAPRELYRAQGFPDSYKIDIEYNGKPMTKTAQVRMCGNSVCPPVAAALIRANLVRKTFGVDERVA